MKKIVCYILVLFLFFQGNTGSVRAEEYNTPDECVTQDEVDSNPLAYNIDAQKRIAVFLDYMDSEWVIAKRDIYIAKDDKSKSD